MEFTHFNAIKRISLILSFIMLAEIITLGSQIEFGGWVVYWDKTGFREIEKHGELFNRISLFAIELNKKGEAITEGLSKIRIEKFIKLSRTKGFSPWVTIVNDLRMKNKKSILKDNKILKKIFNNTEIRRKHFNSLLKILKTYGFEGVDLDFENIPISEEESYQSYIIELSSILKNNKIKLKIIVEPVKGPIPYWGTMNLLIMSYNLHGNFTEPGPRSTPEFIKNLKDRVEGDAKNMPSIAIALKGFLWRKGKDIIRYSWKDSQKYLKSKNIKRDSKSKVPFLKTKNGNELWFDDPISIKEKIDTAIKAGFKEIMFWYMGSNDESFYDLIEKFEERRNK